MKSEATIRAQKKYNSKIKRFEIYLRKDKEEDKELIDFIEKKANITAYFKCLIEEDLRKEKK